MNEVHHVERGPEWADEEVSRRLPALRTKGEGQSTCSLSPSKRGNWPKKSHLDDALLDLVIAMDEMPYLSLHPGPDHLQMVCADTASQLREFAIENLQDEEAVAISLQELADKCDRIVATLTSRHSGTWMLLEEQCPPVRELARELRDSLVGDSLLEDGLQQEETVKLIKTAARKLRVLLDRFEQMIGSFRQNELLAEAGQIGESILEVAYHPSAFLSIEDAEQLRQAAMDLHLLSFHEQEYKCVGSEERLRNRLVEQVNKIEAVATKVD